MIHFRDELRRLLDTLRSTPGIRLERDYIGGAGDTMLTDMVCDATGLKMGGRLQELYAKLSSCDLQWTCDLDARPEIRRYRPEDDHVSGRIHIRAVEHFLFFDARLKSEVWAGSLLPEEAADLPLFRYFDDNDDYIKVGVFARDGTLQDELMYLTQRNEGFGPFNSDVDGYLTMALKYMGYQGWPYNHLFPTSDSNKRMRHYLAQIFPSAS